MLRLWLPAEQLAEFNGQIPSDRERAASITRSLYPASAGGFASTCRAQA